jgi:hypothetical protein
MARTPPDLDMTVEGNFRSPPRVPLLNRILIWAVIIAVIAGALSLAALALWVALLILPVALGAAVVAWGIWRYQIWRAAKLRRNQPGAIWRS